MLKIQIMLRSMLRWTGLNTKLAKFLYPNGYEQRFDKKMFTAIKPGDIIWDVGANVGYYTVKFAAATGDEGFVQGFEPILETFNILKKATSSYTNIGLTRCALGRSDNNLSMLKELEVGSPHNKILMSDSQSSGDYIEMIKVRSGDSLIGSKELKVPNFIKIDVEGHEIDVIKGIADLLKEPELRTIAIEMHFALLEGRGLPDAPMHIVAELKRNNFTVVWTDPSHIIATRS